MAAMINMVDQWRDRLKANSKCPNILSSDSVFRDLDKKKKPMKFVCALI